MSDTHGNVKGVESLLPIVLENSACIHLGDGLGELRPLLEENYRRLYFCRGNCDFYSGVEEEGVLDVEDLKIFYCHGHRYGVKTHLEGLAARAKSLDCQVALYGHTHQARIDEMDGVTLVCPGTLKFPVGKGGSYAYLVVVGKKVTITIVGENPR